MLKADRPGLTFGRFRVGAVATLIGFLCFGLLTPAKSQSTETPIIVGVNRVNIAWMKIPQIENVLRDMAVSHVKAVRLTLSKPYERSIEAVKFADDLGMSVLLDVTFKQEAFPPGTKPRPGRGRTNDVFPLSRLSQSLFAETFQEIWAELEARGIRIMAIELGNEINWGAFNGDLLLHAVGLPQNVQTREAEKAPFEAGLKAYVEALAFVKALRDKSRVNRHAKIISAGLAFLSENFSDRVGIDYVAPQIVMERLRQYGINRYVDAYGVHLYPNIESTAAARRAALAEALSFCGLGEKPCWLTEWGLPNKERTCPPRDERRAVIVSEMRRDFLRMSMEGRLQATFYYDWSSTPSDLFSIWRCGVLTQAGRRVVASLP